MGERRLCSPVGVLGRAVRRQALARRVDETLDRIGAFPNERRPRIVWIGSRAQDARFRRLALSARSAYGDLGVSFDDDTIAHVTIARIKGAGQRPVPMLDVAPIGVHVGRIVLFESIPDGATTRYAIRADAPLSMP